MPIYTGLVTIKRNGRYLPPGTPLELNEDEAKALGPSRVRLADDQDAASAVVELESAGDATGDAPPVLVAPPAAQATGGASNRIAEISAAIDLLEADDFFKTGKREGKPKQKPLEGIVGFDITDADIDAALALREAGV